MLARLAEAGILPRVEIISTVSGGSIVGTAYYLLLRREMERKGTRLEFADYERVVHDLDELMRRVAGQRNVRNRVFLTPKALLYLIPRLPDGKRYSRTDRLGDLLDKYLYKELFWPGGVEGAEKRDEHLRVLKKRDRQVELRSIGIRIPVDPDKQGSAKVPKLVINATSLNSGHLWEFDAYGMGERVGDYPDDADTNVILPWALLEPDPEFRGHPLVLASKRRFPLAKAVAASAAFPVGFPPLPVSEMYERFRVKLSDGGVADNQGIQVLLRQKCDLRIVSDGSGQMADKSKVFGFLPLMLPRISSIQSDTIRDLRFRKPNVRVRLIHMRKGLRSPKAKLIGQAAEGRRQASGQVSPIPDWPLSASAVEAISRIRTDLDKFSGTEIDSLEYCGYVQAANAVNAGEWPDGDYDDPGLGTIFTFPERAAKFGRNESQEIEELKWSRKPFLRSRKRWGTPILAALVLLPLLAVAFAVLSFPGLALRVLVALVGVAVIWTALCWLVYMAATPWRTGQRTEVD